MSVSVKSRIALVVMMASFIGLNMCLVAYGVDVAIPSPNEVEQMTLRYVLIVAVIALASAIVAMAVWIARQLIPTLALLTKAVSDVHSDRQHLSADIEKQHRIAKTCAARNGIDFEGA